MMKHKLDIGIQFLLGLFLVVVGLNKFIGFMAMPAMPETAGKFMEALAVTGYMLPMVGIVEILCGALLLIRKWSALALLLLTPLSVNLILFHLFLAPAQIGMALFVAAANVYLLLTYKATYHPVLRPD